MMLINDIEFFNDAFLPTFISPFYPANLQFFSRGDGRTHSYWWRRNPQKNHHKGSRNIIHWKSTLMLEIIKNDPWLEAFHKDVIEGRYQLYSKRRKSVELRTAKSAYFRFCNRIYLLFRTAKNNMRGGILREWAPHVTRKSFLIGSFNDWQCEESVSNEAAWSRHMGK